MSNQALERPSLQAWVRFLRAHSALTRSLNGDLLAGHGLTINDYEVLLHLNRSREGLRRVDLAERLVLTASGITRLLDGLERAGYVTKRQCESDARVTYAVITDEGHEKLRTASETHISGIRSAFESRLDDEELASLAELLGRLPAAGSADEDCGTD